MPRTRAVADPAAAWWARIGVQTRILATVVVVALLGMVLAGAVLAIGYWVHTLERIDTGIAADVDHFRRLAERGSPPGSVRQFGSVEELLAAAVQYQAPQAHQTFLALVDGVPRFVPGGDRPLRLEAEPDLVRTVAALPADAPVVIRSTGTGQGSIRYAAVPVRFAGSGQAGTYVIAYALDPVRGELWAGARLYLVATLLTLAVIAGVGQVVSRRLLRPLRDLRETAERIGRSDLTRRIPVRGEDDVSDLTRTVNGMLDRIEGAFASQQHFLDDAGHELRTPLTIVRGHLEMMSPTDPVDVVEIRDLVLDEVTRMSRLVADLTMITKSGRPNFLHPEPVDVAGLLTDVVEKAKALGGRTWSAVPAFRGTVRADRHRLTQALLQLAANAVQHTVAGDEIVVGASASGCPPGWVRFWVRDRGPGIPVEHLERVFDRFARAGQDCGSGAGQGSGLGLAIVAAIAAAHGGRAWAESAAGLGTTVLIEIPGAQVAGARAPAVEAAL